MHPDGRKYGRTNLLHFFTQGVSAILYAVVEVVRLAEAQDLASDGIESAQPDQAAGFVASHP